MTNSAQQLLATAILLLDEGDLNAAEVAVREALTVAEIAGRRVELVRGKALLGEILLNTEREEEAASEFRDVLALGDDVEGDELAEELQAARHWLDQMGV